MTNDEKIKKIQSALDSESPRLEIYYNLLEDMGDTVYNYTDYVEQNVDKEIRRLYDADYHMCCCILTLILRENYFINGKFERRYREGKVTAVLERMLLTLKSDD